jgi:hypothetical protein
MKFHLPILVLVLPLLFISCKKDVSTTHQVQYKVNCECEEFEFLYMNSEGKVTQLSVNSNSVEVFPMNFENGSTYLASAASGDLQSQITISLFIDGIKTVPEATEDLVFAYAISGNVEN